MSNYKFFKQTLINTAIADGKADLIFELPSFSGFMYTLYINSQPVVSDSLVILVSSYASGVAVPIVAAMPIFNGGASVSVSLSPISGIYHISYLFLTGLGSFHVTDGLIGF